MSTASPLSETQLSLIDQRLDAIDRALLGLVPRSERLAMVGQVEARIRELAAQNPAFEAQLGTADESPALGGAAASVAAAEGRTASTSKKRSRLALASMTVGSSTTVCNQPVATCVPYPPPTEAVGYATGSPPMYVPGPAVPAAPRALTPPSAAY